MNKSLCEFLRMSYLLYLDCLRFNFLIFERRRRLPPRFGYVKSDSLLADDNFKSKLSNNSVNFVTSLCVSVHLGNVQSSKTSDPKISVKSCLC